ncbi:MAG: DUF86 domain-containing protein [Candidatus Poribacteria bacterium]|nr:DUF86 domain-containing protein [Candidatus Poribacteria bacterium]
MVRRRQFMSRRDDRVALTDMRNHAVEAVALLGEASLNDLAENRVTELALIKLVEIVGEAANRISVETQQSHKEIPWTQIIGMRNRLVHGYDDISLERLWNTIKWELPPLMEQLDTIIGEENL